MGSKKHHSKGQSPILAEPASTVGNAPLPTDAMAPEGYPGYLTELIERIRGSQLRAVLKVNQEFLWLCYSIGLDLDRHTQSGSWGTSVVDRLAKDLQQAFPGMAGFSPRNLRRMRAFYRAYPLDQEALAEWPQAVAKLDAPPWPLPVAKLPWAHNAVLLEKCPDPVVRLWYAEKAVEYGWSRNMLALQIANALHVRQGKAVTNFQVALPPPQSDLAEQALKDPYIFDFLTIHPEAKERDLEDQLVRHITKTLMELGTGFAFVGKQVHLEVAGEDYYLDLLFYHTRLHCYVVLELKARKFQAEDVGKMNFYLSAVDDILKGPTDQPSIGLILCKEKHLVTAEYALRDLRKPIGVAEWETRLVKSLPEEFQGSLPRVEDIERELGDLE